MEYVFYSGIYTDPHNHYLLLLYNTGAIGLSVFLWLFVSVYRAVARTLPNADPVSRSYLIAFLYALIALLVSISFVVLYSPLPYVWSYIGAMTKLAWLARNRK